jgi:hypothetical protein
VGRRAEAGRDGLGVLVARLAEVGMQVDEPGRDHDPGRLDTVGIRTIQPGDRLQDAITNDDVARTIASRRRVDHPHAAEIEVGHERGTPASRYSNAIRIATPFVT